MVANSAGSARGGKFAVALPLTADPSWPPSKLNYTTARSDKEEQFAIRYGIVQVRLFLASFLRDAERVRLNTSAPAYLD